MNLRYFTIAVSEGEVGTNIASAGLPLAYFVTTDDPTGWTMLFPEALSDVPHAGDFIAAWTSSLSPNGKAVLAEVNEEDLFRLRLFANGNSVDEYVVQPGYADGVDLPPSGGNIAAIRAFFAIHDPQTIQDLTDVLTANRYDDAFGFGFAKERHGEIAELLGLPSSSVGMGYDSLSRGGMPEETSPDRIQLVSLERAGANAGMQLRQYVLFITADPESAAQIAARFLPDVISWDDEYLVDEPPMLGTLEQVRTSILEHVSVDQKETLSEKNWLTFTDADGYRIEIDLVAGNVGEMLREVRLYSLTIGGKIPETFFRQLCRDTTWRIWDYRTRQIVGDPPRSAELFF